MKRPQSAKHGNKGGWGHASSDAASDQENNDQSYPHHRKKVKILKPDFTTNDFARILPKKIYQDKQRLYSQALQLKQHLNQTSQQNTRLKTKIAILEKEKQKMNKFIQSSEIGLTKGNSRLNIYSNKQPQKQNTMVRNLKKMIRQGKDENQFLKQQNNKIKKAIKYTKINQLEIQRKMLLQENKRVNSLLIELNDKISQQSEYQRQLRQLRKYLEQQIENNKQLAEANQNYMEYIESLQEKIKKDQDKNKQKQQKLQRQLALAKRKLNQQIKQSDQLRKQVRNMREQSNNEKKKLTASQQPQKQIRPTTSHPYARKSNNNQNSSMSQLPQQKQFNELKSRNAKLQNELLEIKNKFKTSQNELHKLQNKIEEQKNSDVKENERNSSKYQIQTQNKNKQFDIDIKQEVKKVEQQKVKEKQNQYQYQEEYEEQFEQQPLNKKKKQEQNSQIQKYKKDFNEENDQAQQIYQKQEEKSKKNSDKKKKQKPKKGKEQTTTYKPNKKILSTIKELLTYRMKAQRYPFDELKKDIEVSGQKQFKYIDLMNMFKTQPFYLTIDLTQSLLKYIFQSQNPLKSAKIAAQILIKKLRKCIEDFQLVQQQQQEQMLLRIAQMTSTYPNQLQAAFEKVKNGQGTINKANLIEMFQKLELVHNYIQLIIAQLSLCSEDLDHLNYFGFFERFYINEVDKQLQSNQAIDEEQIESSAGSSKPLPKSVKKHPNQFEDEPQFNYDRNQQMQLSMGVKDNQPYYGDQDIVSDDDKI